MRAMKVSQFAWKSTVGDRCTLYIEHLPINDLKQIACWFWRTHHHALSQAAVVREPVAQLYLQALEWALQDGLGTDYWQLVPAAVWCCLKGVTWNKQTNIIIQKAIIIIVIIIIIIVIIVIIIVNIIVNIIVIIIITTLVVFD